MDGTASVCEDVHFNYHKIRKCYEFTNSHEDLFQNVKIPLFDLTKFYSSSCVGTIADLEKDTSLCDDK